MNRPRMLYLLYGSALFFYLCTSHVQGWGSSKSDKISKVPPSMRNNPQAFRTHYFFGK